MDEIDRSSAPTWKHESDKTTMDLLRKVARRIGSAWIHYVVCRGDVVRLVRYRGVRVGVRCSILNKVQDYGSEPWLVEIGNRVTITAGVVFITHDGASRVFRHLLADSSPFGNRFGTIRVLDNSFIGAKSILLPDVTIGPNSIVGAGSVVNKDVAPNTVAAGVPARRICSLDEYIVKYKARMVQITSTDRRDLRKELTAKLWGEIR